MAQKRVEKGYFTFNKGLNTDASPFSFPENYSVDELNFELLQSGDRRRRLGIDVEDNYATSTIPLDDTYSVRHWKWLNAGQTLDVNFVVSQVGNFIYFYDLQDTLSNNIKGFSVDLLDYKVTGQADADVKSNYADTAYGQGYLCVVHPYCEPFYISYDPDTDTITVHTFEVLERDFTGADDGLAIDERPATLSENHYYNLFNQGWDWTSIISYETSQSLYPANSQIWFEGKYVNPTTGKETFDPVELEKIDFGNSRAPRGRVLRNVFDTFDTKNNPEDILVTDVFDSSGSFYVETLTPAVLQTGDQVNFSGLIINYDSGSGCGSPGTINMESGSPYTVAESSGVANFRRKITFTIPSLAGTTVCSINTPGYVVARPIARSDGEFWNTRFTCVAFYAGRMFFGGHPNGKIYFSQLLRDMTEIGLCYQSGDPTAEFTNTLVDTDGGEVRIAGMGVPRRMTPVQSNLVIYADNGIWMIGGGESEYFKATSYSTRFLSGVGVVSPQSVVMAEGIPYFTSLGGIFTMQEDKISGYLSSQSISAGILEELYNSIPDENKQTIVGEYDQYNKRVVWLYGTNPTYPYRYNKLLMYDLKFQAFFKYEVPSHPAYLIGVTSTLVRDDAINNIKYCTIIPTNDITYAVFKDESFLDWSTVASSGSELQAQNGSATTLVLNTRDSLTDYDYNGDDITLVSGPGAGQTGEVFHYDGDTQTATMLTRWKRNLLTYSNDVTNATYWTTGLAITKISSTYSTHDGEARAQFLYPTAVTSGHYIYGNNATSGGDHVFSFKIKPEGVKWLLVTIPKRIFPSQLAQMTFDCSSGVVVASDMSGIGTYPTSYVTDYGVVDLGGGYYQVWLQATVVDSSATPSIQLADESKNLSFLGSTAYSFIIYDINYSPYTPNFTLTETNNDYSDINPFEDQNLLSLANASLSYTPVYVFGDTLPLYRVADDSSLAYHSVVWNNADIGTPEFEAAQYEYQFIAKYDNLRYLWIQFTDPDSTIPYTTYDLVSGTVIDSSGTANHSLTEIEPGIWRISGTVTMTISGVPTASRVWFGTQETSTDGGLYSGTGKKVYIGGFRMGKIYPYYSDLETTTADVGYPTSATYYTPITTNGEDAPAYLEASYEFFQDTMRNKNVNYFFAFFNRTENAWVDTLGDGNLDLAPKSSCLVSAYWDWRNSNGGSRVTSQFQAYRYRQNFVPPDEPGEFDPGFDVVRTKNKLRGHGTVVKLRFDSEPGKACHIYGWALSGAGYTEP